MSDNPVSRRDLLAGVAGAAAGVAVGQAQAQSPTPQPAPASTHPQPGPDGSNAPQKDPRFFLNDEEARFLEAAVERLIPSDATWPGAAQAGVVTFIDRQFGSDWGAGARMYLQGPWLVDAPPEQGYQLRHAPAELYRIAIAEIRDHVTATYGGREFSDLAGDIQDEVLSGLETSTIQLPSIPSVVFFETLLANTIEGFFADPAYGGNRDMAGWRMVGFPGAYASYIELVGQYGIAYTREPISFANEAARQAHIHVHDH